MKTKRCPKCDIDKPYAAFSKDKNRKDGLNGYCKGCRKSSRSPEWSNTSAAIAYAKNYRKSLPGLYVQKKGDAKYRGIEFTLTLEQYSELKHPSRVCEYCDMTVQQSLHSHGKRLGVDRVDNEVGYTVGNCVPCCTECNSRKGKQVLGEQWIPPKEKTL